MSNIIQKRNTNGIAQGSLSDIARKSGVSLAEAFISCDAIVVVDGSGSMMTSDVKPNDLSYTRHRAACDELERLQRELPGKIAVVAFSNVVEFCPSGFPCYIGGGTAMDKALSFVKVADGCEIKLILISDGWPDDPDETLRIANTFTSKIDCVFIGKEGDAGALFLRKLSEATGGMMTTQKTSELSKLGTTVRLMIGGA